MVTQVKNSIDLDELSQAYCLAVANSYRLVEDAEKLFGNRRFLAAVASCKNAVEELLKAHLISKAVLFDENDAEKWDWFWDVFPDRLKKLNFLETEIHSNIFKNRSDTEEYMEVVEVLKENFVGVWFDKKKDKFAPPGDILAKSPDERALARRIYEYVLSLYKALNIHGLPKPWDTKEVFKHMREKKNN